MYHVTANGTLNGTSSTGFTLELYISYDDLGIKDPESIKLCFNFNDVSEVNGVRSALDNYFINGEASEKAEESLESYFSINDLIK